MRMMSLAKTSVAATIVILPLCSIARQSRVEIKIYPTTSRIIVDEAELDRDKFFGLCDHGTAFRERCKDDKRFEYLVKQDITFGRQLGPVNAAVRWGEAVVEDQKRPGFADINYLKTKLEENKKESDPVMLEKFKRLDIAAHGQHNAFPDFMGKYSTSASRNDKKPESLPENIEAAAELSAYVMKYAYNDFDRPAFYEPINEPHYSFFRGDHLAKWHLATLDKVHEIAPGVKVGGPCIATAYFYKKGYDNFNGFAEFIDATECRMDFYSFHIYDFLKEVQDDFGGRITTGLPCEGMIDLVQNYTVNKYGKQVDLVFSEHGGYESDRAFTEKLAKKLSGSGFKKEMKQRSIYDFNAVSSAIANTMTFMNHPHVVKKAVPFILLESMGWNLEYYATLYAPHDYKDKSNWVASRLIDFYKLFKGVEGRYIKIISDDPDIQALAFASGSKMFILLNNLSAEAAPIAFNMKDAPAMAIRRFGRNNNFAPYFKEERLKTLSLLSLKGRESVVIMFNYGKEIPEKQTVIENVYYGDKTILSTYEDMKFKVKVPQTQSIDYAILRVAVSRPSFAGTDVSISLNKQDLEVPLEDCAERLSAEGGEYASTKLVSLDPDLIQGTNTVSITFPDGKSGAIGSVVIRAAHKK